MALLAAELVLRAYLWQRGWTPNCYLASTALFAADPLAGARLRPGTSLRSSAYEVSINALGFRGPEISEAKPEGIVRIAVLGGSSVFGYLVPDGREASRLLEEDLRRRGIPVEVINAGVPGYNLYQTRIRFRRDVARLAPDVVLLYLGWNDLSYLLDENPAAHRVRSSPPLTDRLLGRWALYGLLAHRLRPARQPRFAPPSDASAVVTQAGERAFDKNLTELVEAIRASGARPVLSTQVMAAGEQADPALKQMLGTTPAQRAANARLGAWLTEHLRAFAARHDLTLIDAAAELPADATTLGDPIHLSEKGERMLAELWAEALAPILPEPDRAHRQGARL